MKAITRNRLHYAKRFLAVVCALSLAVYGCPGVTAVAEEANADDSGQVSAMAEDDAASNVEASIEQSAQGADGGVIADTEAEGAGAVEGVSADDGDQTVSESDGEGADASQGGAEESATDDADVNDTPRFVTLGTGLTASSDPVSGSGDTTYISDLSGALTGVTIKNSNGDVIDPSTDVVYVGDEYTLSFSFAETNDVGNRVQFKNNSDNVLTYTLSGTNLNVKEVSTEQPITNSKGITVGYYTITKNDSGDYAVTARFLNVDDDGNATEAVYFDNSSTTKFQLDAKAKVVSSDDEVTVKFSDNIVVKVKISSDSELSVVKKATYRDWAHAADYTIQVLASKGSVTGVTTIDTPSGDYVTVVNTEDSPIKVYELDGKTERTDVTVTLNADGTITTNSVTLGSGDGYIIKYTAKFDTGKYAEENGITDARFTFDVTNTAEAEGTDIKGNPVKGTSTNTIEVTGTKIRKSGNLIPLKDEDGTPAYYDSEGNIVFGGTDTSNPVYVIEWTVTVGDGSYQLPVGTTFTDAYDSDQMEIYTGIPLSINYRYNTDKTYDWASDVTYGSTTIGGKTYKTFTVTLPMTSDASGSSTECTCTYYTLVKGSGDLTNYAYTMIGGLSSTTSGTVHSEGNGIGVTKQITGSDADYVYYQVNANIPAGWQDQYFYLVDSMSDKSQLIDASQIEVVKVERTVDGRTTEIPEYSGSGDAADTWIYKDSIFRFNCNGTKSIYTKDGVNWLPWGIEEASTLTLTYKISKLAKDKNGSVLKELWASSDQYLKNVISLQCGSIKLTDTVYYAESNPITKASEQDGSALLYHVRFNNLKEETYTKADVPSKSSEAALPTSFSGAYLTDTFDSQLTLKTDAYVSNGVECGIVAKAYRSGTNMSSPADWQTRTMKMFYCPSSSISISGNTMTANWSDFVMSDGSTTLESYMESNPTWCVEFQYYTIPDDPAQSGSLEGLTNTAKVGWTDNTGDPVSVTTPSASNVSAYTQSVLDKTGTRVSDDSPIMLYELDINGTGSDLTAGATLTITDKMSSNLVLDYSSIEFLYPTAKEGDYLNDYASFDAFYAADSAYYSEDGARSLWNKYQVAKNLEHTDYNRDENLLTFTVSDDIRIEIDYKARISETGDAVYIENSAQVEGFSKLSDVEKATYAVSSTSGSGSSEVKNITVLKQDAQTSVSLDGAKFALYGPDDATKDQTPTDSSIPTTITTKTSDGEQVLHYYGLFETGSNALTGAFVLDDNSYLSVGGLYTLVEVVAPAGYSKADPQSFYWIDGATSDFPAYTDGDTLIIKDSYETTSLTVKKAWDDNGNQDGLRAGYAVTLYANGEPSDRADAVQQLSAEDPSCTWKDLPVYEDGERIAYSVVETTVPDGYASSTDDGAAAFVNGVATITNAHVPETTSITIQGIWDDDDDEDGIRPDEITVEVLADGEPVATVTLQDDGNGDWTQVFDDLPKYKDGEEIIYTIRVTDADGYTSETTGNSEDGFVIINSHTSSKGNVTPKKDTQKPSKDSQQQQKESNTSAYMPKTGDSNELLLLFGLMAAASASVIAAMLAIGRRQRR